jgi:hypothetical protein
MTDSIKTILESCGDEASLSAWFDFGNGFEIELAYLDKDELQKMLRESTRIEWENHQRTEKVKDEIFVKKLLPYIKAWRGLTPDVLATLLPIDPAKIPVDEMPCTDENKRVLIERAYGFMDFIQEKITSLTRIREAQREAERKNSETSHTQG